MKLLHPRYWATWLLVFFASLFSLVPVGLRDRICTAIGGVYSARTSRHRLFVEENLKTAFSELSESQIQERVKSYFVALFQVFASFPMLWWWPRASVHMRIELHGHEQADQLLAAGESVIFLVSHSLALDFGLVGLARHYPLHGIYKPFRNDVIDWVVKRGRNRFGGITIARDEGLRAIIRNQKEGKCLIYLGDEDLGTQGAVFAPFFDGRKATLTMLPRLAAKVNASTVPVFTHYDASRRKFVVTMLPAIEGYPAAAQNNDKDNDTEKDGSEILNATLMNKAIEKSVGVRPEQYFWKLKYFKTTEDGSDNIYRRALDRDI